MKIKVKDLWGDYLLITILAIIAFLMLSVRIVYQLKNRGKIDQPETIQIPETLSEPAPTISDEDFERKFPLWRLLPYEEESFAIEKYTEPQVLKVRLKKGKKEEVMEKIIEWIDKNEGNSETHRVVWE